MADRKNKARGEKNAASTQAGPPRQSTFFISGEGIDREVITTDICRYLGNDALVKPGAHVDKSTGRSQEGFYITAYRPPTSAQLADLRADSQKWREERRNSARPTGDYGQSNTRQEAMNTRSDKMEDHSRPGGGVYSPSGYGQMAPPSIPAGPTRQEYNPDGGYLPPVNFQNSTPGISQVPSSGAYQNPTRGGYSTTDSNYTYNPVQAQPNYNVLETRRDRMETAPGQSPWNMPPSTGYGSSTIPQSGSGYSGRPAFAYPPVGVNPNVPSGYGRSEPQMGYGNDPFGPRDSGIAQPEPQADFYNDEDMYDEEPSAAPAPAHAPSRRGERDSRERHDEPRRKGHSHR